MPRIARSAFPGLAHTLLFSPHTAPHILLHVLTFVPPPPPNAAGSTMGEVLDVRWANDDPNPTAVRRVHREREEATRDAYMQASPCVRARAWCVCVCWGGEGGR